MPRSHVLMMLTSAILFGACDDSSIGAQPDMARDGGSIDQSASAMDAAVDGMALAMMDMASVPYCVMQSTHPNEGPCDSQDHCPSGALPVGMNGICGCYATCDPKMPATCTCDRGCTPIGNIGDGGLAACVPENGPGERCYRDPVTGQRFGLGGCVGGSQCFGGPTSADAGAMSYYCFYRCHTNVDCPSGTSCNPYIGPNGESEGACVTVAGPHAASQTCSATDGCQAGLLCDGTCKTQCNGPGAACSSGTCTAIMTGGKILGYVCK